MSHILEKENGRFHQDIRSHIGIACDRMKDRCDVQVGEGLYVAGDLVWFYNLWRKQDLVLNLQKTWEGPYRVTEKMQSTKYRKLQIGSQGSSSSVARGLSFEECMGAYGGTVKVRF